MTRQRGSNSSVLCSLLLVFTLLFLPACRTFEVSVERNVIPDDTATPTARTNVTETFHPTPFTAKPARTSAPTSTPGAMPTNTPQPSPASTDKPQPSPTSTDKPRSTATPTARPPSTATPTDTPRSTPTPTDTMTPLPTPTSTPQPTLVPSGPPHIVSFTASPSPADPTGTIMLSWNVRGANSVTVQWLDKNMESVARSQLALSGSLSIPLSGVKFSDGDRVQFTVLAHDANDQLMLDENEQPVTKRLSIPLRTDMTITSFTASPDPVERGGTVTLTWDAPGAASVGITRLSPEGSIFLATEALDLPSSGSLALPVPDEYVTAVTYYLGARDANDVLRKAFVTASIVCWYEEHVAPECPLTHNYVTAAYGLFERGHMVWRGDTEMIYVLYDNGSYETHEDTWNEGDPVDIEETPPQGLLAPVRGFGKLWTSQPDIRDGLGWATAAERSYTMVVETVWRYRGASTYLTLPDNRVVHFYAFSSNWEILP